MYKYFTLLLFTITLTSQAQWDPKATSDSEVNADVSAAIEVFSSNPGLKPFFEQACSKKGFNPGFELKTSIAADTSALTSESDVAFGSH